MNEINRKELADANARQQALDVTQSFIVQAPAGSGKTGLLIQRYLALLANVENPEEVIAITFTRKAAAEMRDRVLSAFASLNDPEPEDAFERQTKVLARQVSEHAQERQWSLSSQPSRLRIMTIDAFNASLVRQMPWLSGTGSEAIIHDDPEQMHKEAAWEALSLCTENSDAGEAVRTLLMHMDNNSRLLSSLITSLYHRRDQWMRHLVEYKLRPERRKIINATLVHAIEDELLTIRDAIPDDLVVDMMELASVAAQDLIGNGTDSPIVHCLDLVDLPDATIQSIPVWQGLLALYTTKTGWRRSYTKSQGLPPERKQEKERIKAISQQLAQYEGLYDLFSRIRDLPHDIYDDDQWQILDALIEILPIAAAQLKVTFRQHGAIDYIEQSQAADKALGTDEQPTDLALALDYRIHHILIDEFQDTSHSQHRLLEKLVTGWEEGDGRTLFIVGDPMQSIYGFREADVSGFLHARINGIGNLLLKSLILQTNFRSTPQIVDWVNRVFPHVMPAKDDMQLGGIHYEASVSANADDVTSRVELCAAIDRDSYHEAQQITELIQRVRQDNPEKSIGVLVRSRTHLHDLTPVLDANSVMYQAVEISPLQNRPVVIDLISLTRAMLHLHDRIAWLAILRAPWCGLTLETLHALVGRQDEVSVWEMIQIAHGMDQLDVDSKQRLGRMEQIFRPWFEQRKQLSLRTGVEWIWHALGGPVCYDGQSVELDAENYFELLDYMESHQIEVTIDEIYRMVTDLYAKPVVDSESTEPFSAQPVQLMSIHKSKGLQFDVVILPGLERQPRSEDKPLLVWHEEQFISGDTGLLIAPLHSPGKEDAHYEYVRQRTLRRRQYETQRLLYVAITRAKQQVYLFGSAGINSKGDLSSPNKNSLLSLIWPVVATDFENNASTDFQHNDTLSSSDQSLKELRRLPADWQQVIDQKNIDWQESGLIQDDTEHIEFSWAGEIARHIGTVTHQFLSQIASSDILEREGFNMQMFEPAIRVALATIGVDEKSLASACDSVVKALLQTVEDPRGRWILTGNGEQKTEYAISGILQGRIINRIIDRTFVDKEGTRWIIDFKTSTHAGSDLDSFLDNEKIRYQAQLEEYAALYTHRENRPIRLGLYFPLLRGWRAWEYHI
ncbi:MAG: DNA helicase UvrD [Gammaproteobacteria bacterium]|nr:MAG: DNA helicase UvrD [Gammaproteobacteria bacterium]